MDYIVSNYTGLIGISGMSTGNAALVTDLKTGGIFIYMGSGSTNGGTVFNGWVRQYSGDLNVLWFGVTADGVTDDTEKINSAVQYASSINKNIFFPTGTYYFNSQSGNYYGQVGYGIGILYKTGFKMYGEKGTIFKSSKTNSLYEEEEIDNWSFILIVDSQNITIEGIEFMNTHVMTSGLTTTDHPYGIYLIGMSSNNHSIKCNVFSGFYNSIVLNAGTNNRILENIFLSQNGHDDSADTSEPAVYISVQSNNSGNNRDLIVRSNYAEGYSGNDITQTYGQRSMDGFYYGYADGAIIENNTLLYFCEEAIYAQGYERYQLNADIRPTIIRGNYIDSKSPTGTTNTQNFGIRADGSNYIIENNYIRSGYGILCYGIDNNRIAKNVVIRNNRYFAAKDVGHWFPIFVQGYITGQLAPAKDYLIENNELNIVGIELANDLNLLTFADSNYINVKNNKIYIDDITQNGHYITIYKFAQNCDYINYGKESIIGNYDNLFIDSGGNSNLNYL